MNNIRLRALAFLLAEAGVVLGIAWAFGYGSEALKAAGAVTAILAFFVTCAAIAILIDGE